MHSIRYAPWSRLYASRMPEPLVSVLTPVYNAERYIEEVMESVRDQSYGNIEHVIVDDGSTDGSAACIERFMTANPLAPIRFLRQENAGEATAVNHAFSAAEGEYVVVVNADDPPMVELVRAAVRMLGANEALVVAYPDWLMIDAMGREERVVTTLEYSQQALVGDYVCLPGPGAVIRRAAVSNGVLRDTRYRFVSDYELWLRLSLQGPMTRCPGVLATWRNHSGGATAGGRGQALAGEVIKVIDDFFARDDLPHHVRAWERQAKAMALYHAAIQKLYEGSVPGRRLMARSILTLFRRRKSYPTVRRSPLVVLAVLGYPLSTGARNFFK